MKRTVFFLTLALGALSAHQESESAAPGPRAGIGGLAGFTSVSTIEFVGVENPLHTFAVDYIFPDRARWSISAKNGQTADRTLYYRFGEGVWSIAPGRSDSLVVSSPDRDGTLLQMELRRSVMLYPLGFAWSEASEGVRFADVLRQSGDGDSKIGRLVAELDTFGRPSIVRVLDSSGQDMESLRIESWQTLRQRECPERMTLRSGTDVIWTETVESLDTRITRIDAYFQPADRRKTTSAIVGNQVVRSVDLRAITYREHALPEHCSWELALESATNWIESARSELDGSAHRVDSVPAFELDAEAVPTYCIVRLESVATTPPENWSNRPDRPGIGILVDGVGALNARILKRLGSAAPKDSKPGRPYCRVTARDARAGVQLYLPLDTQD